MKCDYCDEPILPGEPLGYVINSNLHHECAFRMGAGSYGHIAKLCHCYGGSMEDPPGMTKRESAKLALALWRDLHPEPPDETIALAI